MCEKEKEPSRMRVQQRSRPPPPRPPYVCRRRRRRRWRRRRRRRRRRKPFGSIIDLKLASLALDAEHLNLEQQGASRGNTPRGEPVGAVSESRLFIPKLSLNSSVSSLTHQ